MTKLYLLKCINVVIIPNTTYPFVDRKWGLQRRPAVLFFTSERVPIEPGGYRHNQPRYLLQRETALHLWNRWDPVVIVKHITSVRVNENYDMPHATFDRRFFLIFIKNPLLTHTYKKLDTNKILLWDICVRWNVTSKCPWRFLVVWRGAM